MHIECNMLLVVCKLLPDGVFLSSELRFDCLT